jgi:hypothetical protein
MLIIAKNPNNPGLRGIIHSDSPEFIRQWVKARVVYDKNMVPVKSYKKRTYTQYEKSCTQCGNPIVRPKAAEIVKGQGLCLRCSNHKKKDTTFKHKNTLTEQVIVVGDKKITLLIKGTLVSYKIEKRV